MEKISVFRKKHNIYHYNAKALPEGTVRTWGGQDYKKTGGDWVKVKRGKGKDKKQPEKKPGMNVLKPSEMNDFQRYGIESFGQTLLKDRTNEEYVKVSNLISDIKSTYDENNPRTKRVLRELNEIKDKSFENPYFRNEPKKPEITETQKSYTDKQQKTIDAYKKVKEMKLGQMQQAEATELQLEIENDADLYRQQFIPIVKNIQRKVKNGTYDHNLAPQLWQYLVDNGTRKMVGNVGGLDKVVRMKVAQKMADEYIDDIKRGEYEGI